MQAFEWNNQNKNKTADLPQIHSFVNMIAQDLTGTSNAQYL